MDTKKNFPDLDPFRLFGDYMKLTGVPTLHFPNTGDPRLAGKKLGIVNGSNWISLWSTWFGKRILPEVKLVQVGNEGVQLNFMEAFHRKDPCPPQINIELFCRYAEDLYRLYRVDAILITCSTMNRSAGSVRNTMAPYGVPVVQIDEAIMEEAVLRGGKVLVVATHGPTVQSTQSLLRETAALLGKKIDFAGATVEEAFELLGKGEIEGHNRVVAEAIHEARKKEGPFSTIVLAQLSMAVLKFSWPDGLAEQEFGAPVLTSGETGFRRVREVLLGE